MPGRQRPKGEAMSRVIGDPPWRYLWRLGRVLTAIVIFVLSTSAHAVPGDVRYEPDARFTLVTGISQGLMVYIGRGGTIDGVINPTIEVREGSVVQITLINGHAAKHDIVIPDFGVNSQWVTDLEGSTVTVFRVGGPGESVYFCSIPGHREAGMEGLVRVVKALEEVSSGKARIVRSPSDLPAPVAERGAKTVRYEVETLELEGQLTDGTSYTYWTFDGQVPGPMFRVRVGDTVEIAVRNHPSSLMIHSIDLHAVNGPGGGGALTQVPPGERRVFTFKALVPGLYVYHCATPMVANHIASGMYGMILVEPEGGLAPVEREYYIMQGEVYTAAGFNMLGYQEFSVEKLLDEQPDYFVFNGAVGALTKHHPLSARVGETVRIFFGVGGPNFSSTFHVIGEIFDRVYEHGSLQMNPLRGVQTIAVPPGGAAMLEFKVDVPGRYMLVDHALARVERGLVGFLIVEGPANPQIYHKGPAE